MSRACPFLGFVATFELHQDVTDAQRRTFRDDFIALVHGRGLACRSRGSRDRRWSQTVHGEAFQATDADRQALIEWAAGRSDLLHCDVGPLVDLDEAA